ncbi:MAG: monofunctional biosynthetic peptidoglycan transglycosylase [Betaproteobacteria bacterium]|nr:monofunctional biosynthetic peptidoglycan transglycosylase [Betaproteobacteria bacterium]
MRALLRLTGLLLLAFIALQLFFVLRIALMAWIDPQSTAFQRSEALRILREQGQLRWQHDWVPYAQISRELKRAVIVSEDDGFIQHEGVDWDAVEKAWQKNARAEQALRQQKQRVPDAKGPPPKVVGGSTITQQLAKNLLLSGERHLARKAQELLLTYALELLLSKQRILEIYLNSVEWGEGIFGAEAAARRYFGKSAAQLDAYQAARLAVMLPRPKFFEKRPESAYVEARAQTIMARMPGAQLP